MEITHVIIGALALICIALAYACRRLSCEADNTGLRDYTFSLERSNQNLSKWIYDLEKVVAQVGELLDHAGVDLERSSFQQESADLKLIGNLLRRTRVEDDLIGCAETQTTMMQLGDRYGIEPYPGVLYSTERMVRIAEEIIERVLPAPIEQRSAAA